MFTPKHSHLTRKHNASNKCLLCMKELSKAGCPEEAGLRPKLEMPRGPNHTGLHTPGSRASPVMASQLHTPSLTVSLSSRTLPESGEKTTATQRRRRISREGNGLCSHLWRGCHGNRRDASRGLQGAPAHYVSARKEFSERQSERLVI